MPKRLNLQTIPSPKIQGDDSWIQVKSIMVEQYERRQRLIMDTTKAAREGDQETVNRLQDEISAGIAEIVVAWNWVDGDDKPLPQPHNNPDVLKMLTMEELNFILEIMDPFTAAQKKTVSGSPSK